MNENFEYKCPCCGGKVEFNIANQNMKCPFCDSEFNIEALKENDEILNKQSNVDAEWNERDKNKWQNEDNMNIYTCQSCGGEIITDSTTAASHCPYCDNPIIFTGQLSGEIKPDFIIPFKFDKKQAKQSFYNHLKNKKLLPKVFKDENHIDEIKGIYVPFWLFDADVKGDVGFSGTKSRSWSDSNYIYKETSYYAIQRGGTLAFSNVPVDGSSKMEDELMESIEPFNFSEAVDFQTAYLSGFLADKYDVHKGETVIRANERIKKSTERAFQSTVNGYQSVKIENSNLSVKNGTAKYVLYPVWILNTTWNDEKFRFAMNGQTGKFVGNLPCDTKAAIKWFFGVMLSTSAIAALGAYLSWLI